VELAQRYANRLLKDVFAIWRSEHDPDNKGPKPVRIPLDQLILAFKAAAPRVLEQAFFNNPAA
jgi:hypothetical protein